jgi:uncharacterized protein (TIGR00106 family)
MEFAIFPTDKGESVSPYVARVIKLIKEGGYRYQFTPMGTIVEVDRIEEATQLLNRAYSLLEPDCNRVYLVAKMDIRKGKENRMEQKIRSEGVKSSGGEEEGTEKKEENPTEELRESVERTLQLLGKVITETSQQFLVESLKRSLEVLERELSKRDPASKTGSKEGKEG